MIGIKTKTRQTGKRQKPKTKATNRQSNSMKELNSTPTTKHSKKKNKNGLETKLSNKPQSTILLGLISGLTSLAIVSYIGISSKNYLTLKSDIEGPTTKPPQQTIIEEQEITSQKLPSIEPDLDALKVGQKNGIIGRDNPMSKLFLTKEDLDEILSELGASSLTDDEMKYIVANLAVNTTKNYNADKNLLIQSVLELQQEQNQTPQTTLTE